MIAKTKDPVTPADRFEQAGVAAEEQMAFYLPRAYETFTRNGWEGITPWPVDFRSGDLAGLRGIWRLDRNLLGVNLALKEYLGTLVYRMTGK